MSSYRRNNAAHELCVELLGSRGVVLGEQTQQHSHVLSDERRAALQVILDQFANETLSGQV